MPIPLEDQFEDILGKAQRGLRLSDEALAAKAGVHVDEVRRAKSGDADDAVLARLADALSLGAHALVDAAHQAWSPEPRELPGLACFHTPFEDMHVNAYVLYDESTKVAALFDTGASALPMLDCLRARDLRATHLFLTHTHRDHVADLKRVVAATGARVLACELETVPGADTFAPGASFRVGALDIATRLTSGHSPGGISYVVSGLGRPVAVVGDALFAGSMGGGLISYADALANNRRQLFSLPDETVLCPGHGPLTTVGEEKAHNPFYPEFQPS